MYAGSQEILPGSEQEELNKIVSDLKSCELGQTAGISSVKVWATDPFGDWY